MRKTLKRFLTTALCSATLVAAGLGVNALTTDVAAAEVEPAELKIAAQTLNVSDNVNMVYLVPVAAGAKSDITVYVTENDVKTPIYADATNATYGENEYYRFIYRGITAYEMDTNLYAYAEMGGVKSEEVKYSVLQYAYTKLGMADKAKDETAGLENLLTAMLNYGTAAANFKGNDIDLMADYTYVSVEHATFEDNFNYGIYKKGETITVTPDVGYTLSDSALGFVDNGNNTYKYTVTDKFISKDVFVEDEGITALDKVEEEKAALTIDLAAFVGDTMELPTVGEIYENVTITWSGAGVDGDSVTFDAEGTVTLTATIECDGATATKTFPVTVTVNPYPVEGKAYALKTANGYYITEKSTKGFTASQDVFSAISFYFEKAGDGAYYLVCDGQYVATNDGADLSFGATEYAWSLNTTTHQIYAPLNDNRFLGLHTNNTSVKAYATNTNYPAVWFEPIQEWTDADRVADEVKNFTTEYSTNGGTNLNLPTETDKFGATISWVLDGKYDFVVSLENGVLVTTNPAEDKTVNVKATISLNGVNSESISCAIAVKHIEEGGAPQTITKDDFNTLTTDTGYSTRKTTNGWTATNAAVVKVNNNNTVVLNGKTSAVGTLTSPTLSNGLSSISFDYTNTYSESKGVDLQISIKQNGAVVATKQLDNNSVTQKTVYTYTWNLADEGVDIVGDYTIEIKNNSPSKSTSNKDRVSIWNISCVSK